MGADIDDAGLEYRVFHRLELLEKVAGIRIVKHVVLPGKFNDVFSMEMIDADSDMDPCGVLIFREFRDKAGKDFTVDNKGDLFIAESACKELPLHLAPAVEF